MRLGDIIEVSHCDVDCRGKIIQFPDSLDSPQPTVEIIDGPYDGIKIVLMPDEDEGKWERVETPVTNDPTWQLVMSQDFVDALTEQANAIQLLADLTRRESEKDIKK